MRANITQRSPFRVRFWGVRGSYPTSERNTLAFGGHTSCVEVQVAGHHLIFDAGTGIIALGEKLVNDGRNSRNVHLFLSHTHHDHIFGLYFFQPLFRPGSRVSIFGPGSSGRSLKRTLQTVMEPRFFPVELTAVTAQTKIYSLRGGERVRFAGNPEGLPRIERQTRQSSADGVTILVRKSLAHPHGVLLYRVSYGQKSMIYATDIEQDRDGHPDAVDFFRGADLLIHDGQYLEAEYSSRSNSRRGWGHSTVERAVRTARKAGVKQLVLFHHDPDHDDRSLKRIERLAERLLPSARVAYEGLEIKL
jgi:phosphoribosyl 1,2-cyclic phosphodiesterase